MLRPNLSTRPFYNERAASLVIGLLAIAVAVVTVYNVTQLASLTARHAALRDRVDVAERRTAELRAEAARSRGTVDQQRLDTVALAAQEVNAIIDRRTFSWTELFNRIEATLPDDVRITSVRPDHDQPGTFLVTFTVEARGVEGVDAFMEALESTRMFRDVLVRDDRTNVDGLIEATVHGLYVVPQPPTPEGAQP